MGLKEVKEKKQLAMLPEIVGKKRMDNEELPKRSLKMKKAETSPGEMEGLAPANKKEVVGMR
jgi:hypothetical protein